MRKLVFLFIFALIAVFANAQVPGVVTAFVNDTTTNTETEYMVFATPKALTVNYVVGIELKAVNSSGTPTVTAAIQTSNDGTNWFEYGSSTTINNAGTATTYSWILNDYPFKYIRMKCVSSGTGVTVLSGNVIIKKPSVY